MTGGPVTGDQLSEWLAGTGEVILQDFFRESLDVIAVIDPQLIVRYINWTTAGLTREDVVGKSVLNLVPPDDRETARKTYTRVLATGIGARFDTLYTDGKVFDLWDVRVGPIRFQDAVIGLIVVTNNVTEQRREQSDRDRFFSLSLDSLVVASPDGRLTRINPAFAEILGYAATDLIDTRFLDLVHPDDRASTVEAFKSLISGTPVYDFENRYLRSDGEYRVFSWRATVDPITGDAYAVARDVTEHRATEAQLRQAQRMEAVGRLAGGIAHDFNNLMLAILTNAELALSSPPLSDEGKEHLDEILEAVRRASDLTTQLLAFSRRQPLRLVTLDLNKLIEGLMKMLQRLLPENITVELRPGHDVPRVNADPTQVEQVLINLCLNARDAMGRGGALTIRTENAILDAHACESHPWAKPGRYAVMSVTDEGVGMTAEVRERIFEPFFTTKSPHHGTGLGLSTAYGIVQQHAGLIRVHSEVGRGTTFQVYLPADPRAVLAVDEPQEAAPPRGHETILVAEDEKWVRRALVRTLERAGYRTFAASNGLEAIDVLRTSEERIDLVVLDVVMPELGGPETWEAMRTMRSGLRVLFTTGYADDRYLAQLPPGAEVLGKPFQTDEFLSRIRKKLDE